MEKKEDRRVQMTKRMLKDALTETLHEKDIYHISVRELCEKADVNRTTFYKYYSSEFDLLADMENDLLEFLAKTIKGNESDLEKIIVSVCMYLEQNIEFVRLIVNNNIDPSFPQKVFAMDVIKDTARKRLTDVKSEAELEYIYYFLTYGAFSMICVWLNKEKRESPKYIAALIGHMV